MRPPSPESDRIDVMQGPEWLVDLLLHPPWWLRVGLGLLVVVVLALAAVGIYRRGGELDDETQDEMLENASLMVAILCCGVGFAFYAQLPYVLDLAGGVTTAYVLHVAAAKVFFPWLDDQPQAGRRKAYVSAWWVLGLLAIVPMQFAGKGAMPLVSRGGFLLLAVCSALGFYNATRLNDEDA